MKLDPMNPAPPVIRIFILSTVSCELRVVSCSKAESRGVGSCYNSQLSTPNLHFQSSIFTRPIIGNLPSMGGEPVFIRVLIAVDLCGTVDHHGFALADAFEAMVDIGRDL